MATIAFTTTVLPQGDARRVDIRTWVVAGATSDVGTPYTAYLRPDKTIQLIGTFSSTTVLIEGSNDGTNWATLTDADGNLCSFTSADMVFVREAPQFMRPNASGGTGSITVILVALTMGRDW